MTSCNMCGMELTPGHDCYRGPPEPMPGAPVVDEGTVTRETFRKKLASLINAQSMENGSDTPDYMLAEFLFDCLVAFDKTVRRRETWYGRGPQPVRGPDLS